MPDPKRPLIVVLDVEPGPHHDVRGDASEWDDFLPCVDRIGRWRDVIEAATDAPAAISWALRVDAQIEGVYGSLTWSIDRFADVLGELAALGDDFGIHPHLYRRANTVGSWCQDYVDTAWLAHSLPRWLEAYSRRMGAPPSFFRSGDRWLSAEMVEIADNAGIPIDLSVEPGRPGGTGYPQDRGVYPDYTLAPREPYQPTRGDFLAPTTGETDGRDLWMLPVTTACVIEPTRWHVDDHEGHQVLQLNLNLNPAWIQPMIDVALRNAPLLVAVGRTGDLAEKLYRDNFWANWRYLWTHRLVSGRVAETPAAALERYLANTGAPILEAASRR